MARDHEILRRLIPVDRALASADGAAVRQLARELRLSQKTIRRALERLHEVSPLVYWETARSMKWWQYAESVGPRPLGLWSGRRFESGSGPRRVTVTYLRKAVRQLSAHSTSPIAASSTSADPCRLGFGLRKRFAQRRRCPVEINQFRDTRRGLLVQIVVNTQKVR